MATEGGDAGSRPPRPTLNITAATDGLIPSPAASPQYYYFEGAPPMTPVGHKGGPLFMAYPNKASEFMFKQFEGFKDFTVNTAKSGLSVGEKASFWMYGKVSLLSRRWFTHIFLFLVVAGYSFLGGLLFMYIEGAHEEKIIRDMYRNRRELAQTIIQCYKNRSIETKADEDLCLGQASLAIQLYETQLKEFFKEDGTGIVMGKGDKREWDYWSSVFYCGTIYTTIGYGHIAPATTTGKALTIVYATIGIPLFLILLADFGKLFTRGIKWVWAFVRRLYYTGSCKKVRKTARVQEVMKGVQLVYDIAAFRRPSSSPVPPGTEIPTNKSQEPDTIPSTPAPSNFVIDEEFNLPISLAIIILVLYIFCGAVVFFMWEEWSFFDSFYFVFISMSTIGFGDFVPKNKMYMMASIVYLAFGLALTSMCINVVQEKLSDTFRQASSKIGATIGLKMKEVGTDDLSPNTPTPVELAQIHQSTNKATTPSLAAV